MNIGVYYKAILYTDTVTETGSKSNIQLES
jgi:hypothetical protein